MNKNCLEKLLLSSENKEFFAQKAMFDLGIMQKLRKYSPESISTIFAGLDIDDSDIDIICSYSKQGPFIHELQKCFGKECGYIMLVKESRIIARFKYNGFMFEIYASNLTTKNQLGYRHFQIMKRLVEVGGNKVQMVIRNLKRQGLKTEPAIAELFSFSGDPYNEVLKLEAWSNTELKLQLNKHMQI